MEKGLIHIYCGDGKGKTTAAFGLAFRCAGRGGKVVVAQFLKSQETGEVMLANKIPEIKIIRGNPSGKFTFQMNDEEKQSSKEMHNDNFKLAIKEAENDCKLLVLDEIMAASNYDMIDYNMVLDYLKNKPEHLEVVLTGRDPRPELLELADYVSEIKKIKHPYDQGIYARDYIER